jgi:uncharacterized protein (DUF1015 family)
MSDFIPIKALRPRKRFVEQVAAYPYDVVEEDEARRIGEKKPLSFLHVEKSEINLPFKAAPDDDRIFASAKDSLERLIREGILFQEEKACYYVYGQKKGSHSQYGIVGGVSVAEYEGGQVKKHELITPNKFEERVRNIDAANADTGLVFLVYPAQEAINSIVEEIIREDPEYDFVFDNGVQQLVWVVSDEGRLEAIRREFLKLNALYIADGHHRAAAAAEVAKMRRAKNPGHSGAEAYNYFVGALFPHNQVKIMDYNRAVKDLNGLSEEELIRRIRDDFHVYPDFKNRLPSQPHEFGMYLKGKWHRLQIKGERIGQTDLIERLDVWLLQNCLLSPVLGIKDQKTDKRIKFIGGIRGAAELERLVDSGEFAVAFSLYPPRVKELMDIADSGRIMPPKSTWFEPKLLSGVLVHLLEN